ncbi:hypothetical protein B9Z55_021257 [Caenorhabditis nigoni]|nr:hypothetical protein B9Z55_021257 [Caenorhabditis nigoni]
MFELECNSASNVHIIVYERNGIFTLITCRSAQNLRLDNTSEQKELVVPQHFLDVFLEDLETVLMNQETVLKLFHISWEETGIYDANCVLCLEEILKARTSALAVNAFLFNRTTVSQGMSMIRYLNSEELNNLIFVYPLEPVSFEDFLEGFRSLKEGYRFILEIHVNTIARDDVMKINEFSSLSGIIDKLTINSKSLEGDCRAILSDKFDSEEDPFGWVITFKNPSLMKTPAKEKTPIICDVCEKSVRSVFGNPLLMKSILERLECFDIQRLRKVNRMVRECIDTVKPNPHIETYLISIMFADGSNLPRTDIELESGDRKEVLYLTLENQLYDSDQARKSLCPNDFEENLKHQKSCIGELTIGCGWPRELGEYVKVTNKEYPFKIGEILRRREHPLRTRKFSIGCSSQTEVMEILPAIDKEFLKSINILSPFDFKPEEEGIEELPFEVDQLSQTEQWKSAERLIFKYWDIATPIQEMNILHFAYLKVLVSNVSSQDVDYLQTNLLESSTFQKFKISFWQSAIDESIHQLIGEPYRNFSNLKKVWYFRMKNTDYYIHIVLDMRDVKNEEGDLKPKSIIFTRVANKGRFLKGPLRIC